MRAGGGQSCDFGEGTRQEEEGGALVSGCPPFLDRAELDERNERRPVLSSTCELFYAVLVYAYRFTSHT